MINDMYAHCYDTNVYDDFARIKSKNEGLIIGIHGFAQSGKDTIAKIMIDNFGFKRLSFADALREGLYGVNPIVTISQSVWDRILFRPVRLVYLRELVDELGWDVAKVKYPEVRRLLQCYGTEGGRNIHGQDCWTNIVKKQIEAEPNQDFVITDVRFPNEKVMVDEMGGTIYRVMNDRAVSLGNHASEQVIEGLTNFIDNNGTLEELREKVISLVTALKALKTIDTF